MLQRVTSGRVVNKGDKELGFETRCRQLRASGVRNNATRVSPFPVLSQVARWLLLRWHGQCDYYFFMRSCKTEAK